MNNSPQSEEDDTKPADSEKNQTQPQGKWYWRAASAMFDVLYRAVKKANGENPS